MTNLLRRALVAVSALAIVLCASASKYNYDTIPGDPLKAKIYTLPNGLRIYMSVNKDTPKIYTHVSVRVGGKNDPAETTGLAHYFEHLMFKGTEKFGTADYTAEKPMLDRIETLFETYRHTSDPDTRAAIYHQIDSISYEASKIAIPNEYDKLMSAIGSTGTNAYTSYDVTAYVENIPSNQLEAWAMAQADRFMHPVIRGFHTELETIYEEKNMSLTNDADRLWNGVLSSLYPNHPYGSQTILGSQEHLKNPSITNVKNYHRYWYVPNNTAILLSGDFDPDEAVDVISRYFGGWAPNPNLRPMPVTPEKPITARVEKDVTGQEAEQVVIAWRFPGERTAVSDTLSVLDMVICNGSTGLIDLNINLAQKALGAYSTVYGLSDYSALVLGGTPNAGQSLEELRDLLIEQVQKACNGEFDESMLKATFANQKLQREKALESNSFRVDLMQDAFVNNLDWADVVSRQKRQEGITKQHIVDFARANLSPENCVVVYKRQGKDSTEIKIAKPRITPIEMNRDSKSRFLQTVQNRQVDPIDPVFVDFDQDLTFYSAKNSTPVIYKQNTTNDVFSLIYVVETGTNNDLNLEYGPSLLDLSGTPDLSAEEITKKFYELACSYSVSTGANRSYIVLTGLSENMIPAMELMEKVIAEAVPDQKTWDTLADRYIKGRSDAKHDQSASMSALSTYGIYGKDRVNHMLSNEQLRNADPAELLASVRKLTTYPQRVIYYGPKSGQEVVDAINKHHRMPGTLTQLPEPVRFHPLPTAESIVYIAPYDANQLMMYMISNYGKPFDPKIETVRRLYNNYFGGDMSSIVFQEMREARSLAYSAWATLAGVGRTDEPYLYYASIATQNDKLRDAIETFHSIIEHTPRSEASFDIAKKSTEDRLRTSRTIKDGVAWSYINCQDLGLQEPLSRAMFEQLPSLTLDDVMDFQQKEVKDHKYSYMILGRIEDLDMDYLRTLGKVVILTPEETFGY